MEIEIPKDISGEIERTSQEMGLKKKELMARAIKLYIRDIKEQEDLNTEIDAWERAAIRDSKF